jgi:hypothetical protein
MVGGWGIRRYTCLSGTKQGPLGWEMSMEPNATVFFLPFYRELYKFEQWHETLIGNYYFE